MKRLRHSVTPTDLARSFTEGTQLEVARGKKILQSSLPD
jgi:hypothetical protein